METNTDAFLKHEEYEYKRLTIFPNIQPPREIIIPKVDDYKDLKNRVNEFTQKVNTLLSEISEFSNDVKKNNKIATKYKQFEICQHSPSCMCMRNE